MNLSKSQKRIESKKRKISAFLQVAQLNDEDKKRKIIEPDDEDEHLSKARHHGKLMCETYLKNILYFKKSLLGELPKIIKAEDETFDDLRQRLKARKKLLVNIKNIFYSKKFEGSIHCHCHCRSTFRPLN